LDALCAAGADRDNALLVAESLAFADARGTRSHGLNMLDAYLERIRQGGINTGAKTSIVRETSNSVVIDCNGGFGQTGVQDLMDRLLEKIKNQSIVCGSVRNINHCGALAFYTRQAAVKGFLSFLFANANPTVAHKSSLYRHSLWKEAYCAGYGDQRCCKGKDISGGKGGGKN
jgi:LDH2 family malate/lactate/ureidoglycolate dehydrogenase